MQADTYVKELERGERVASRNIYRSMLFKLFSRLQRGSLYLVDQGDTHHFGEVSSNLVAHIIVTDPSAYHDVCQRGTLGAGEAYMRGAWDTPDLVSVVRIMVANMEMVQQIDSRISWFAQQSLRLFHWLKPNTLSGSKRNIAAHYDLSNAFFELFLDRNLMYSSAIFPAPDATLEEAANWKLDLICRKLELTPGDHLLEIGTGWGGMALFAAREYGCRVTTTTISEEQHRMALDRVDAAGLSDRVTVLKQDYRELDGQYDKLVSIEMIEAVGHRYLADYFRGFKRLLKPDGLALVQAITIPHQRYDLARRSVDFIQRYIFPGGSLPSVKVMTDHVARETSLEVVGIEEIGLHYARTLFEWRRRFNDRIAEVRALGFDDTFIRMWQFYLCYCEGGFAERVIGTSQLLLAGPDYRGVRDRSVYDARHG